jgi:hypothetical protein
MKRMNERLIAILFGGGIVLYMLMGIPMITSNTLGANATNGSTLTKVYVWNTEPNISHVFVSPTSIDLNAGNITTINCTAYVFDYNGWEDIDNVSAHFYDLSVGDGSTSDNNYRYINSSCQACISADSSGTNASCTCQFNVLYYANPGQWQCNITVSDGGGNATQRIFHFNDSDNSSAATITQVLGISVPSEIDYGNLSVTETSQYIPANLTNWGNIPINISVRQLGNISINSEHYFIDNNTLFTDMANLTSNYTRISNLTLPVRTNDTNYGNDTNTTFWRIKIPLSVGGYCNGTVQFSASQA